MKVENIETAVQELKAKGVNLGEIQKGVTSRYIFFYDPDKLPIELYEP